VSQQAATDAASPKSIISRSINNLRAQWNQLREEERHAFRRVQALGSECAKEHRRWREAKEADDILERKIAEMEKDLKLRTFN
jgi:hypothetical protein